MLQHRKGKVKMDIYCAKLMEFELDRRVRPPQLINRKAVHLL
jgi:hypothetical protein